MDDILNKIQKTSIFNYFNFKKNIEQLIIDNIEYNKIINAIKKDNNSIIYIGEFNDNNTGNGIMIIDEFIFVRGTFTVEKNILSCEIFINNNLFYKGNLINGYLNGKSIIYLNNKVIFEGLLENNIINDENCWFKYSNNDEYKGSINNNILEGYGIFTNDEGIFKGEFINNEKHGNGILYLENVSYEGRWINNKKNKIFKLIEKSLTKFIEYDNDIIIKQYSQNEYIIKYLNEKLIIVKQQHLTDINEIKNKNEYNINEIKNKNEYNINEIKTICEKKLLTQEQDSLKKIEESNNNKLCKICFINPSNVIFDVCSHIIICEQCEIKLRRTSRCNKCPVCRSIYHKSKKVFFS